MQDSSVIRIDLSAVDHNMQVLRRIVGADVALCPIVKADAYGLGAVRVAERLFTAGADMLAVYTPKQAAELARAAIDVPVLVLMPVRDINRVDELYRGLISGKLHLTVHDDGHLNDLIKLTERFGTNLGVHLEVDTGMSRGGCPVAQATALLRRITQNRRMHLAGLFTHFINAESDVKLTDKQLAAFDALVEQNKNLIPINCVVHAASSFATLRHQKYHKQMVRIGLAWAGYGVEWIKGGQIIPDAQQLRPIVTWASQIVQVKEILKGATVGYGSTWTARRNSRIALVPAGYADGYPIGLGHTDMNPLGASVGVEIGAGEKATLVYVPVIGAINMDVIAIDVTDLGTDETPVDIGTAIELISPDPSAPNHLTKLAAAAATIPHEVLCRLNPRLQRVYHSAKPAAKPIPASKTALAG